jgi:hypothetical protein
MDFSVAVKIFFIQDFWHIFITSQGLVFLPGQSSLFLGR